MSCSIISNFSFEYDNDTQPIINNLNIKIDHDQETSNRIALIASNGVGKSTILRNVWNDSFHKPNIQLVKKRIYLTQDIPNFEFNPKSIQDNYYELEFQRFTKSEFDQRIWDHYIEIISSHDSEYQYNLGCNLLEFGIIPNELPSNFNLLSPGTKKKVILSIALASKPDLVIADELTNHLDRGAIETLLKLVKASQAAWILVDHNQTFLRELVDHFIFIPDNKTRIPIHFQGSFEDFSEYIDTYRSKQEGSYRQNKNLIRKLEKRQQELQTLARLNPDSVKIGQAKKKANRLLEASKYAVIHSDKDAHKRVSFDTSDKTKVKESLILAVDKKNPINFSIGEKLVQEVDNFRLYNGKKMRILGSNGTGKSSFIKLVKLHFEGKSLNEYSDQYISGAFLGKKLNDKEYFAFDQIVSYPPGHSLDYYLREKTDLNPYHMQPFLNRLKLEHIKLDSKLNHLSLGEYIRLQIGIMSRELDKIKLIILDEPGNFLDIYTQKSLIELLDQYSGALLYVTHDNIIAEKIGTDTIYEM